MDHALRITNDLTVIGQVQLQQLQQAAEEGFRSVLNLRSPDELGFLKNEPQLVESLNLHYVNIPLKLDYLDEAVITEILQTLKQLPKPVIVHCAAGIRSTAIALLSLAIQEGLTPEQTLAKARSLGFHYVDCTMVSPELKRRFVDYISKHTQVTATA
ncbi:phosphatase (plasmid) [Kovacikia minuta CCNUW1]|uniref:beta-lactamase hydrolase domain-containing protein n=1 Tax=Kovacikia minuta TaxID=2931930 RepID=UPI001CC95962|nr:sulfur transferase domain-containing protein [Kovacikia minuta]UBF30330.1 phosphatase [Kovacikia minuta CCNUW1]